jgi:malate synthase
MISKNDLNKVINKGAVNFIILLNRKFNIKRQELLKNRLIEQKIIDKTGDIDFIKETKDIRDKKWTVATVPEKLKNRTVEITGPPNNRKMVINALNSGANCYMADFEDSLSPIKNNVIYGQINLYDTLRRNITYFDKNKNKNYEIRDYHNLPTIFIRPRGLHMEEDYLKKNGLGPIVSASIFDFGLYVFNNYKQLFNDNKGLYLYLPKLQNYLEARWWNDIFNFTEDFFCIVRGTIKATVLIEHILAAFQMNEILFELRHHSAGLNCGRWDYIFSFIKVFKNHKKFILPDRKLITMDTHFMNSYVKLLVKTCHNRGVHAMGGMAAQLPVKNNPELNKKFIEDVYNDKSNEAKLGLDGTWIAHPGLLDTVIKAFNDFRVIGGNNQLTLLRNEFNVDKYDLLYNLEGNITINGIKENTYALIKYIESWINGIGAVAINNKMEDAATAEISRMQLWQWINYNINYDKDKKIDITLIKKLSKKITENKNIINLIMEMLNTNNPPEFMTNFIINKGDKYMASD